MAVVGIVIGVLLFVALVIGGVLLWRRMQTGMPGAGQEEGRASERVTETQKDGGGGRSLDREGQRVVGTQNWRW